MSKLYTRKRYGDTEDDDEERCSPPDHGSRVLSLQPGGVRTEKGFAKADQGNAKDLQYIPDSRINDIDAVVGEPYKKKFSPGRNNTPSFFSHSQLTTDSIGISDDKPPFEENTPAASFAAAPSDAAFSGASRRDSVPGAFHDDGRNARDTIGSDDDWSGMAESRQSANEQSELDLVSAEAVDPDETNRIVERELAERQKKAPVAEVIQGFWCSKRVKRMSILGALLIIIAIVLGTVLPRALEPPAPAPAPTAAPTAPLPHLTDVLSSISPDGGEALQTESTPQHKALIWLVNNTLLDLYPMEKKIQRYVLATLYFSTNGNNWRHNTLWLSNDDECGWYNEAKSSFCIDSEVVDLTLFDGTTGNNLVGTIPNEIALLSNSLEKLNLADNTLMGSIPSEIGALSSLNELSLSNNSLMGTLPSEIGSLTNLTWVNLRVNGFTGTIASEIGLLKNLEVLSFSVNKLTRTIPSEIGALTPLESLSLYGNELTGTIPTQINLLTNLRDLFLFDNRLAGDYTCPDYIPACQVSCANDTAHCRSLGIGLAEPSSSPSEVPSTASLSIPPSMVGTNTPTEGPTESPSSIPTLQAPSSLPPTFAPPTVAQTLSPTRSPTPRPTPFESEPPTWPPTPRPTPAPTINPVTPSTPRPTPFPTERPTMPPTPRTTPDPTISPVTPSTPRPSPFPTERPTMPPTPQPTPFPTESPSPQPTPFPTDRLTMPPSLRPTPAPTEPPTIVCGDGIIDPEEECEPEQPPYCPDGQFCHSKDCRCTGCGNGRIDDGEMCDHTARPDGCGYKDRLACFGTCECWDLNDPDCGDGVIDDGEDCGEELLPECPNDQICDYCRCTTCGNGQIDEGEECDWAAEPKGCGEKEYCSGWGGCRCIQWG